MASVAQIRLILSSLDDEHDLWRQKYEFQEDVLRCARDRLRNRITNWMMHKRVWNDASEAGEIQAAFDEFEERHLGGYWRWRSRTVGQSSGDSHTLEGRFRGIFMFYVVYGEIHDLRGIQGVMNLLYHSALGRVGSNRSAAVGVWVRDQAVKFYKLLSLAYSKEEMLFECFHHDDLDDLCSSPQWVSRYWNPTEDAFEAFNLADESTSEFPLLSKVLALEKSTFIKYWIKSIQGSLTDSERETRGNWILQNFVTEGKSKEQLSKWREEILLYDQQIAQADAARQSSQAELRRVQYESSLTGSTLNKGPLEAAQRVQDSAKASLRDATVKFFKDEKEASKAFSDSMRKHKFAERAFEEAAHGYSRQLQALHQTDVQSVLQVKALRDEAEYQILREKQSQVRIMVVRALHFAFEDSVNSERKGFAKKWKTYFERSGGFAGWRGYLTLFNHYSQIIYMHILLLFPLAALYFDWHQKLDTGNLWVSLSNFVALDTVLRPGENILLVTVTILALLLISVTLQSASYGALIGMPAPERGEGTKMMWNLRARVQILLLWVLVICTELLEMKLLVLSPLKGVYHELVVANEPTWYTPILLLMLWIPAAILHLASLQFVFSVWMGVFGFFYALADHTYNTIYWSGVVHAFQAVPVEFQNKDGRAMKAWSNSAIVTSFVDTMLPKPFTDSLDERRRNVAFAKVWNAIVQYFYDTHKLSEEELERFSFELKDQDPADFLSGEVVRVPDMREEPRVLEVKSHFIRFVNNVKMPSKPTAVCVREMLPLNIVTPVGSEKILYSYDFITSVDDPTTESFLRHLITSSPFEWENFKKKECKSAKAQDWIQKLERDVMRGIVPDLSKKQLRWIDTPEGRQLKRQVCEWASIRFQALFRTVNGFMQVPKALELLARIQEPTMSHEEAEELVRTKFTYLIGYQSFSHFHAIYKATKEKAKAGEKLTKVEAEAHEVVENIKHIRHRFPAVKIAYPDQVDGRYLGKMTSGRRNRQKGTKFTVELLGPFHDFGLGKPTHQNFLLQFVEGLIIQAIDVNQDNVISQSFFVPNVLAEFDRDKRVKIIGCPEFVITNNWSSTAWCSGFAEHTFGTLIQRTYARLGLRFHYGHPDYMDALFVMTETGMSKMPYVSEDIFTGFDVCLKGGRIIHVEYHEVGKARDVDLYTTTKFMRKISMGASQMACTRYIGQLQTTWNASLFQGWAFYFSTVGFYVNHQITYLCLWSALLSQLAVVLMQSLFHQQITNVISERVFFALVVYVLLGVPGILQLILELGFTSGIWTFLSHSCILAVYAAFHILNVSSFWQFGLNSSAFYLASGRGTGLEHYFLKDMYKSFYNTHWRDGFAIFWMGTVVFVLSRDWYIWTLMYLATSGVWLWGAMFLIPGSLPTSGDLLKETSEVISKHAKLRHYEPIDGSPVKKFCVGVVRKLYHSAHVLHWLYTVVNFAIHTRVLRIISNLKVKAKQT